ncbi:MAG: anaerobic ribonucleoside-triphosphate reductase activating protein [Tissierellia bacterium]|nr:anaerobic ribonucleoside-triphosphate reductase activating protein [Tissierellia bacterium]
MKERIKIAGIMQESIVDGPGLRLAVFTQGCVHNCAGCHNPETHSFDAGYYVSIGEILEMLQGNSLLEGMTLSGGEPFHQGRLCGILAERTKKMGLNVLTYTGYTYEELMYEIDFNPGWKKLLYSTDILIDGRFDINRRNLLLKFRGSENQRIIDVKKSLEQNRVILADIE